MHVGGLLFLLEKCDNNIIMLSLSLLSSHSLSTRSRAPLTQTQTPPMEGVRLKGKEQRRPQQRQRRSLVQGPVPVPNPQLPTRAAQSRQPRDARHPRRSLDSLTRNWRVSPFLVLQTFSPLTQRTTTPPHAPPSAITMATVGCTMLVL